MSEQEPFKLKLRDDRPATIGERRSLLNEIDRLTDQLSHAQFEWNRATEGMQERDRTIAGLREQLEKARVALSNVRMKEIGKDLYLGVIAEDGCWSVVVPPEGRSIFEQWFATVGTALSDDQGNSK